MNAALGNADLAARTAALGKVRLRPGVEIVGQVSADNPTGNLTVRGDLDLSGYRYGPQANRNDPLRRGFGESAALVLRAAGDLSIYGSINDGFAPPPANPDESGWMLGETADANTLRITPLGGDIVVPIDDRCARRHRAAGGDAAGRPPAAGGGHGAAGSRHPRRRHRAGCGQPAAAAVAAGCR
ncbi:hypothetical protein G6F50_014967 [Rhizopus delemar]|uniref:Uncharacterized protein n=1 Tax=Rhizopus delemar TaxID=936053 RepID=A0A9P7C641_9FUNG|nr:hypothetical protein G6F50_014967 [Rhizopus delemar]